ncbi:hypothetical protein [Methanocorpusculum sp. GPch4]|uniref:hypothetical protein n=1 Tax=Methanocorpusculum sp. GPch4 TaxID=2527877 RepID=UPI0014330FA7|nr:hypothetical protein [Methanocorpusculum sp. GPch4]
MINLIIGIVVEEISVIILRIILTPLIWEMGNIAGNMDGYNLFILCMDLANIIPAGILLLLGILLAVGHN